MGKQVHLGTCYYKGKLCEKILVKSKDKEKDKIIYRPLKKSEQ